MYRNRDVTMDSSFQRIFVEIIDFKSFNIVHTVYTTFIYLFIIYIDICQQYFVIYLWRVECVLNILRLVTLKDLFVEGSMLCSYWPIVRFM